MTAHSDDDLMQRARRRVNRKMGFYKHLLVFVLVNLGLAALSLYSGRHWYLATLGGWGIGLAIHGIVTFTSLRSDGLRERLLAGEIDKLKRPSRP